MAVRSYPTDLEIQGLFDEIFAIFADCKHLLKLEDTLKLRVEADLAMLSQYHFADPLFEDMFREIFIHENPIALILITHLYIESICDKIINKILPNAKEVFKNNKNLTFSLKLDIIQASGKVPKPMCSDIKLINTLRNRTAHNLTYSIEEFDFSRFTFCNNMYQKTGAVECMLQWELHMHVLRYIAYFISIRLARDTRLIKSLKGRRKPQPVEDGDDIPF
jgi:hypothetical protein